MTARPSARAVRSFWGRATRFEAENLEAAVIIAREPVRYPSPAMQTWARMVLAGAERRAA